MEKPPGPWLFRPDSICSYPAPGEESALRLLEEQAAELEAVVSGPRTPEAQVEEAVKRRYLLVELEALGLLAMASWNAKEEWLLRWRLPLAAGYLKAAVAVHEYMASDLRKGFVADAADGPVRGSRISLDWFRHRPSTPEGFASADAWLAFCERALLDAPSTDAQEGEVLARGDGPWFRVRFRKDDGLHPAVTWGEPVGR